MSVLLPIDHLEELWPEKLRGVRLGALLHPASVSSTLEHAAPSRFPVPTPASTAAK